ncbi:MAG: hypothetical protein KJ941_04710 [Bacteroidetes bacterium]|nr:hypothetical protein [Bacteroidota bacterium]
MKKQFALIAILFSVLATMIVSSNLHWGKDRWKSIVKADAKGYYAYLPAVFIYSDLNFGFYDQIEKVTYADSNLMYDYRASSNGKVINKYYCGMAVLEAPFFLIGHFVSYLTGQPMDGYSKWYAVFVHIGALFYLLFGLLFLNRWMQSYSLSSISRGLTILALVFGTNLFYYAITEPALSHLFSFCFISGFAFYSREYFLKPSRKHLVYISFFLGVITLLRPVNILIVLFLPFLAGSTKRLKAGLQFPIQNNKAKIYLGLSTLLFVVILSVQLIIYKISTGFFWVYSYTGEGFHFLKPHFMEILFSYKKGLFVYTPLYFLSMFGLYYFYRKSRFEFWTWLCFFIVLTYILSSWWMWYYGGSFSSRVYVDYLALFALLLAFTFDNLTTRFFRAFYLSVVFGLVLLCQIQTYQYRYYQIHWADMNKSKYWEVFLRIDQIGK